MKKIAKGCLIAILVLLTPLLLFECWDVLQIPLICVRAERHADEIEEAAKAAWEKRKTTAEAPWEAVVDDYARETGVEAVRFPVSAYGLAPSGAYYGVIWYGDGQVRPMPGMEEYEQVEGKDGYQWEEQVGDNGCYLKHITGNIYVYKEWY